MNGSNVMSDADTNHTKNVKIIDRFPKGVITPPPSKSLSHRALICAALADGESLIENFEGSEDLDATLKGLEVLRGAQFLPKNDGVRVTVAGLPVEHDGVRVVDCGESGSTLRFLLPVALLDGFRTVFRGSGRLLQRPLDIYEKIFTGAGALFVREPGQVIIQGSRTQGPQTQGPWPRESLDLRKILLPGDVSSQFISGLLLALPVFGQFGQDSEVRLSTPLESRGYVDLTIDVMRRFGVKVEEAETETGNSLYFVRGGQRYHPTRYGVEADYSQAAFFLVAAALSSDVTVASLNPESLQGDKAILTALKEAGAEVLWRDGKTSVSSARLSAITFDARDTPDLVPPVAALCCFCEGTSHIVGAGRLRLKESDRLSALAAELKKLGAQVTEAEDSLSITGTRLKGGKVDAWGDHRIAMALAVTAIRCNGQVCLSGWRSVKKSYPNFWRDFEQVAKIS